VLLQNNTPFFSFYKEILKSLFDKYLFKFLIDIPVSVDKASIDEGRAFSSKNVLSFNWSQLSFGSQFGQTLFEVV